MKRKTYQKMERSYERELEEQVKQALPIVLAKPKMQELIAQVVERVFQRPEIQEKIEQSVQRIKDTLTPEELGKIQAMSSEELWEKLPLMMREHEQRSNNSG